jgi:hypothetical protein
MASAADEQPLDLLGFARLVIEALEAAGVPYLLGGALAVAAWAEARSTQDVDLVINLGVEQIQRLSEELKRRGMLLPPDLALDLLAENRGDVALVVYHTEWGHKAELFPLRPGDELRASALARRRRIDLGEPLGPTYVHSPEDLILYKLQYFSLSQQTKHVRDIAALVLALGADLDEAYLADWARRLGLDAIWRQVQGQVKSQAKRP